VATLHHSHRKDPRMKCTDGDDRDHEAAMEYMGYCPFCGDEE
jgi:hypothetical protein